MVLHHPMCKLSRCETCLTDHIALEKELKRRCGGGNFDWLSKYHKFMKSRPGGAETEFGWATPESFEEENIQAFVDEWNA